MEIQNQVEKKSLVVRKETCFWVQLKIFHLEFRFPKNWSWVETWSVCESKVMVEFDRRSWKQKTFVLRRGKFWKKLELKTSVFTGRVKGNFSDKKNQPCNNYYHRNFGLQIFTCELSKRKFLPIYLSSNSRKKANFS